MRISDWSSDVCSSDLNGMVTALYSGNLGRKQGLDQVIDLATVLQRRQAAVRIVVRGKGGEAGRLIEEVGRRGLGNIEFRPLVPASRSEEHTSELQSLMRISYAVLCLKKNIKQKQK